MTPRYRLWDGKRMTTGGIQFNNTTGNLEAPAGGELLRYTGRKDANGVEICQGDILKHDTDIILVVWVPELASFGLHKSGWFHTHYFRESVEANDCEVIGNKFESPELLTT